MHELAVCEAILAQAASIAETHQARAVTCITLRIGPLAGVEAHLLRAAFSLAAAGTACEGARLIIDIVDVRIACRLCGAASRVRANRLLCGTCGTWRVALLEGEEMRIESVELLAKDAQGV